MRTTEERMAIFKAWSPFHPQITENMMQTLNAHGYFKAPASTKYHGCHMGGLFDHCYNVYTSLSKLTEQMGLTWDREQSVFIIAFLHDLCKTDQYKLLYGGGYEYNKECLFTGHGDKSIILAQTLLPISMTEEEASCIRYHMGAFVDEKEWSAYTNAIHRYPNVLYTHTADMMAAHIVEAKEEIPVRRDANL